MVGLLFYTMNGFEKLLLKVERYNVDRILFEVWKNQKVKDYIISLNTIGVKGSQLYELGINSLGVSLGNYTPYTSLLKRKGDGNKRVDHITLIDSGDFYDTFFINALLKGFSIEADGEKPDGNILDRFKNVVGLTDESLQLLIEFIRPFYISATKTIV